jgi:hypothetical protein
VLVSYLSAIYFSTSGSTLFHFFPFSFLFYFHFLISYPKYSLDNVPQHRSMSQTRYRRHLETLSLYSPRPKSTFTTISRVACRRHFLSRHRNILSSRVACLGYPSSFWAKRHNIQYVVPLCCISQVAFSLAIEPLSKILLCTVIVLVMHPARTVSHSCCRLARP